MNDVNLVGVVTVVTAVVMPVTDVVSTGAIFTTIAMQLQRES